MCQPKPPESVVGAPDRDSATLPAELAPAFSLVGEAKIRSYHEREALALRTYKAALEDSLGERPSPRDLAHLDSVARCRMLILRLSRVLWGRGITKGGVARAELSELRATMRLESDLLMRLDIKRGMVPVGLRGYLETRVERPDTAPAATAADSTDAER